MQDWRNLRCTGKYAIRGTRLVAMRIASNQIGDSDQRTHFFDTLRNTNRIERIVYIVAGSGCTLIHRGSGADVSSPARHIIQFNPMELLAFQKPIQTTENAYCPLHHFKRNNGCTREQHPLQQGRGSAHAAVMLNAISYASETPAHTSLPMPISSQRAHPRQPKTVSRIRAHQK